MSFNPQEDISTLVKMRRAIRARHPPAMLPPQKAPVTLRDRRALREEAAARWDEVYGVINALQRAYNEAEALLNVSIKVRKFFPQTWQPAYVVSFARPREAPSIEIRLAMREDNVVSFTIAKHIEKEAFPKVFQEGTTVGDWKALQQLFREVVRCYFLKD